MHQISDIETYFSGLSVERMAGNRGTTSVKGGIQISKFSKHRHWGEIMMLRLTLNQIIRDPIL